MVDRKNVMLLCLSTLNVQKPKSKYIYEDLREKADHTLEGYMTNEAPAMRIVKQLNLAHGKRLDRVVMISSETVRKKISKDSKLSEDFRNEFGEKIFELTHEEYFKQRVQAYAERTASDYKEIDFRSVEISSFVDQKAVAESVVQAAAQVMDGWEDIDLYIDFNGGPRHVAVLILALSNLMKLRNVSVKEITFMDFENQVLIKETNEKRIRIENMDAVFGCVDLVSGINEYVNYGRIHILEQYFSKCDNERIHTILRMLGDFANNMQLCLTDYVFENKEKVKRALNDYLADRKEKMDAYEVMFSFVAEDILRGCRPLLEGSFPEMLLWCVEKEFIQQALSFYKEHIPVYLWESGIFHPALKEWEEYDCWRIDCETDMGTEEVLKDYREKYCFMDEKYLWMMHYLKEVHPLEEKRDCDETADRTEYEICEIIGTHIEEAKESAGYLLYALEPKVGRAQSVIPAEKYGELKQILLEYFVIYEQCASSNNRKMRLGDKGTLWNYREMCDVLRMAAKRLCRVKH